MQLFYFAILNLLISFESLAFEASDISSLQNLENCESTNELLSTCLSNRSRPLSPEEMLAGDTAVCKCLKSKPEVFTNLMGDIPPGNTPDKVKASEGQKAGNLIFLQASQYAQSNSQLGTLALVYGGQEARKSPGGSVVGISKNASRLNSILPENESWQCITYQEYSVQREVSLDNNFFRMLGGIESFRPEDWNTNTLLARFNNANADEKASIQARLTFLTRNPIFGAIMGASPSERFSQTLINQKQQELFSIIKLLGMPENSPCFETPGACYQAVHQTGKYNQYSSAVRNFIFNDDVINISSAMNAEKFRARTSPEASSTQVPRDIFAYFYHVQMMKPEIAQKCNASSVDSSCFLHFKEHCTNLSNLTTTALDLESLLSGTESVHASLSPESNPDFRAFNDKICLQAFANPSGTKMNFFQYQTANCENNPIPECSDRKVLLKKFLTEFSSGDALETINLRSGFINFLSDEASFALSEAQIQIANNTDLTPTELRGLFPNGLLPTISQDGRIVPSATPLSQPQASTVAQTSRIEEAPATSDRVEAPFANNTSRLALPESRAIADVRERQRQLQESIESLTENLVRTARSNTLNARRNIIPSQDPVTVARQEMIQEEAPEEPVISNPDRNPASVDQPVSGQEISNNMNVIQKDSSGGTSQTRVRGLRSETVPRVANSRILESKPTERGGPVSQSDGIRFVGASEESTIEVTMSTNDLSPLRTNANSITLPEETIDQLNEFPDAEIPLLIRSKDGKDSLVLYARKGPEGGVTLSTIKRVPNDNSEKIRLDASLDLYEKLVVDYDKEFRRNETLLKELDKKKTFPVILQVMSRGRKALRFKVKSLPDHKYSFEKL